MNKTFLEHQQRYPDVPQKFSDKLSALLHKILAGTTVQPHYLYPALKQDLPLAKRFGTLKLEIVSHCWQYSHFLAYQLSSLASHTPEEIQVTMTVFYSTEDAKTVDLLNFYSGLTLKNVSWNWQELPPRYLYRRAIGRNLAAKASVADWVWFTDCDETFQAGCLDTLAERLQGKDDVLLYPAIEYKTAALSDEELGLDTGGSPFSVKNGFRVEAKLDSFSANYITRATGPLQITHGDIARAYGYCDMVACYQKPATHWCKAHEDRVFRWLLNTQGTPIELPGVYRIQHQSKGRQKQGAKFSALRGRLRHLRYRLNQQRDSVNRG